MNIKASFLSAGLLALGLLVSAEAEAKFKKKPTPTRAAPELNAQHAAAPVALLLAGAAVIAGRRRKAK